MFSTGVDGEHILVAEGDDIELMTEADRPARTRIESGPFLATILVGRHEQSTGYVPVRAYAQPILDGRHFIPVDYEVDRHVGRALLDAQFRLRDEGALMRFRKPLFDVDTDAGVCRPDRMMQLVWRDRTHVVPVWVDGISDPLRRPAFDNVLPRLERIGRVLLIPGDPNLSGGDISGAVLSALGA